MKLSVFLSPFMIISIFPLMVFVKSGEMMDIDLVVRDQTLGQRSILFGPAYFDPMKYFKTKSVLVRRPRILVLGNSRMMQFRAEFFRDPEHFYNSGGVTRRMEHFGDLLSQIPKGAEPNLILLGLDQHFFDPFGYAMTPQDFLYNSPPSRTVLFESFWKVYSDYFKGKFTLNDLFTSASGQSRPAIGLSAITSGSGFRNDGSYCYGKSIPGVKESDLALNLKTYQFRKEFEAMDTGRQFYKETISTAAMTKLNGFLMECRDRNIVVAGIIPPMAQSIYSGLKSLDPEIYIFQLESVLRPLLNQYGFKLYNFSDLGSIESSDLEMIDPYHGSEKVYLRMWIAMLHSDVVLRQYADVQKLESVLRNSRDSMHVFDE